MKLFNRLILLLTGLLMVGGPAPGQTAGTSARAIDAAQWERAAGTLDYSDDRPEEPEPEEEQPAGTAPNLPDWDFSGLGTALQVIAILLFVALMATLPRS